MNKMKKINKVFTKSFDALMREILTPEEIKIIEREIEELFEIIKQGATSDRH